MMPCGRCVSDSQRCASCAAKPSALRSFTVASGSKMRITIFSPNAVGRVDRRISTSSPRTAPTPGRSVLMRPSCGRRFSTTSMRPSSLMRAIIAFITPMGIWYTGCSTPSMRKRITPCSRRGSRWMSLARWSKAYCQSQSTTCTTCWSLASSCLLALPSSTSCSKLPKPAWPPSLLAARTDLASAKNSAV
ncbi:hypothetical protein D9M69_565160 [compost metagenome]